MTDHVDALTRLLETGDMDAVLPHLAAGAVIWHNDDGVEFDARAALARAGGLHALVDDVKVEVVRRDPISDGVVARYVLRARVRATGAAIAVRNCIFVTITDGLIARIDEYLDPTFGKQLGLV